MECINDPLSHVYLKGLLRAMVQPTDFSSGGLVFSYRRTVCAGGLACARRVLRAARVGCLYRCVPADVVSG